MKSRKQKLVEYQQSYGHIPTDYNERLKYLYEVLKIDDAKSTEILATRDAILASTYYETIRMVMYEIPEYTPRPRARLINRAGILNSVGTNSFIQVYSITGRTNKEYMALYKKENLQHLESLLCTPCSVEYRAFFPTPSYYNKTQIFLAEIGLDRPIAKPDFDNIEKSYADAFTGNIWIDDIVVVDASFRKFFSILPRMEIDLHYANQLYNAHQYKRMVQRKDFTPDMNVSYFGSDQYDKTVHNGTNLPRESPPQV